MRHRFQLFIRARSLRKGDDHRAYIRFSWGMTSLPYPVLHSSLGSVGIVSLSKDLDRILIRLLPSRAQMHAWLWYG